MYSIGEIADKMGINASAIRFYDKQGLMPFVERDHAGRRKFKKQDMNFIEVIDCLKRSGVPVKDIAKFIQLCIDGDGTLRQRYDFLNSEERQLTAKIQELEAQRDFLRFKKWYYKTAVQAGTEDVHFLPGTRTIDPTTHQQYREAAAQTTDLQQLITLND